MAALVRCRPISSTGGPPLVGRPRAQGQIAFRYCRPPNRRVRSGCTTWLRHAATARGVSRSNSCAGCLPRLQNGCFGVRPVAPSSAELGVAVVEAAVEARDSSESAASTCGRGVGASRRNLKNRLAGRSALPKESLAAPPSACCACAGGPRRQQNGFEGRPMLPTSEGPSARHSAEATETDDSSASASAASTSCRAQAWRLVGVQNGLEVRPVLPSSAEFVVQAAETADSSASAASPCCAQAVARGLQNGFEGRPLTRSSAGPAAQAAETGNSSASAASPRELPDGPALAAKRPGPAAKEGAEEAGEASSAASPASTCGRTGSSRGRHNEGRPTSEGRPGRNEWRRSPTFRPSASAWAAISAKATFSSALDTALPALKLQACTANCATQTAAMARATAAPTTSRARAATSSPSGRKCPSACRLNDFRGCSTFLVPEDRWNLEMKSPDTQ
mmetsp:Transcript_95984/g.311328  ORF Transcript_95984/g.311328 Transcript_95984/m.311328 type:complete len:449 (-) Transcript_95984:1006-2352(-)